MWEEANNTRSLTIIVCDSNVHLTNLVARWLGLTRLLHVGTWLRGGIDSRDSCNTQGKCKIISVCGVLRDLTQTWHGAPLPPGLSSARGWWPCPPLLHPDPPTRQKEFQCEWRLPENAMRHLKTQQEGSHLNKLFLCVCYVRTNDLKKKNAIISPRASIAHWTLLATWWLKRYLGQEDNTLSHRAMTSYWFMHFIKIKQCFTWFICHPSQISLPPYLTQCHTRLFILVWRQWSFQKVLIRVSP